MAGEARSRERYSEAFWRTHHEAWRQSDLNQREYCSKPNRSSSRANCSTDAAALVIGLVIPLVIALVI